MSSSKQRSPQHGLHKSTSTGLMTAASVPALNMILTGSGPSPRKQKGEQSPQSYSMYSGETSLDRSRSPSAYDDVVRPFVAKIRPISGDAKKYEAFLGKFTNRHGVRAKRLNKHALITLIEEIYAERFRRETNHFKDSIRVDRSQVPAPAKLPEFPEFVSGFLGAKLKSSRRLSQGATDLVSSVDFHRKHCLEADIFGKFMDGVFDSKDLVFFLYIRSLIERALDIDFARLQEYDLKSKFSAVLYAAKKRNSVTPMHVDARHVFLCETEFVRIAATFFGDNSESYRNLSKLMSENAQSNKNGHINATVFLLLMLTEFKLRRLVRGKEVPEHKGSFGQLILGTESDTEALSSKNILMNGIAPKLENLLNDRLRSLCSGDAELTEISKEELVAVFQAHIGKLVEAILAQDWDGVVSALDLSEGNEDTQQLESLRDIMAAVEECRAKGSLEDNVELLANAIFRIPQLGAQLEVLTQHFWKALAQKLQP